LWSTVAYYKEDTEEKPALLTPTSRVVGMFEYLCGAYPLRKDIKQIIYERCKPAPGVTYEEAERDVYKAFTNGKHTETQFFTATIGRRLRTIEKYDDNGTLLNTTLFDDAGQLFRITIWDAKNQKFHPTEYYFSPDKKIRIQASYIWEPYMTSSTDLNLSAERDFNRPTQYVLFDKNEKQRKTVNSYLELIAYCLDDIAAAEPNINFIVTAEASVYAAGVALAKSRNVVKSCLFHDQFLEDGNNLNSSPKIFFQSLCENRDLFDGLIFLTDSEKNDFAAKYGDSDKYYVIPHAYAEALPPIPFNRRDGRKIVILARWAPQKRIEAAVDIFSIVAKQLDDVTLYIYGDSQYEESEANVKKQIEYLGLENRIYINRATDKPAQVFSSAAMFMMTSSHEGLPLTLMESVCNGCPAFAFDIKYGPSDIIRDGETGFLFADGDVKAYALKMVEFLSDADMRRRMSENCYADAERFGRERFLNNWEKFINDMCERERK